MPRAVIADSDDEDSSLSPPRNPPSPIDTEAATNRSSDHVSHETSSTDPAFFQHIYDEQNNAPRVEELPEVHERDRLTSSEMTAPADFHRTKTGLVDPSSLTSITDPLAAKENKSSSDKRMSDWTQVSTPGRKKAPVAKMDDPWDVPSSPEENRGHSRVVKIRLKRSKDQNATEPGAVPRTAPGETERLEEPGGQETSASDVGGSSEGRRKRRKINSSGLSQQAYNEMDLITIPHTEEMEATQQNTQQRYPDGAPSSMLPPTLPVENESSFFVQTKPLSNSQKMEYQSVQLDSSGNNDHHHDALPPLPRITTQDHASSGSATNINTPRSDLPLVSTLPPPPSEPPASIQGKTKRSSRLRRNSSPDIISTEETPAKRRRAARKIEPIPETESFPDTAPILDEPVIVHDESVEVIQPDKETNASAAQEIVEELHSPQEPVYESIQERVKNRKTRGRPKKTVDTEATPTPKVVKSKPKDGEPGTRQKKKRGRPRKSDQAVVVGKSPQVETKSQADIEHVQKTEDEDPTESGTRNGADETSYKEELEGSTGENQVEARTIPAPEAGGRESKTNTLKESNDNTVLPPALKKSETASSKESDSRTTISEESGTKKTLDQKKSTIKGGTTVSKPIYRVGLSKRTRIAPLLKSLRK